MGRECTRKTQVPLLPFQQHSSSGDGAESLDWEHPRYGVMNAAGGPANHSCVGLTSMEESRHIQVR